MGTTNDCIRARLLQEISRHSKTKIFVDWMC